jgi:hypothetical protein
VAVLLATEADDLLDGHVEGKRADEAGPGLGAAGLASPALRGGAVPRLSLPGRAGERSIALRRLVAFVLVALVVLAFLLLALVLVTLVGVGGELGGALSFPLADAVDLEDIQVDPLGFGQLDELANRDVRGAIEDELLDGARIDEGLTVGGRRAEFVHGGGASLQHKPPGERKRNIPRWITP